MSCDAASKGEHEEADPRRFVFFLCLRVRAGGRRSRGRFVCFFLDPTTRAAHIQRPGLDRPKLSAGAPAPIGARSTNNLGQNTSCAHLLSFPLFVVSFFCCLYFQFCCSFSIYFLFLLYFKKMLKLFKFNELFLQPMNYFSNFMNFFQM